MKKVVVLVLACVCLAVSAYGNSLSLQTVGIVGTIEGGETNASIESVTPLAQYLLDMAQGAVYPAPPSDPVFKTNTIYDYAGTLTGGERVDDGSNDVTGFDWVLAKYDGPQAGYVLFKMTGPDSYGGTTIPLTSEPLWMNQGGNAGLGLSGFTGYKSDDFQIVPDGGMTLMLLGGALVGLEMLRRRSRV